MSYLRKKLLGITAALTVLTGVAFGQTVQMVTADITEDTTWTSDTTYILTDIIYVDNEATLTIQPGTIIRGEQKGSDSFDPGTLVVTRGATLEAEGTFENPIIWCSAAVDNNGDGEPDTGPDLDGDSVADFKEYELKDTFLDSDPVNNPIDYSYRGLWGGLIILGNATTNVNSANPALSENENFIEGLPDPNAGGDARGVYGGTDDDDYSGTITYNSFRNGGSNLAADNEINGVTMGGVGRRTVFEFVEVFANLDDGFEWFGGTMNTRYLVSAFNDDDAFDIDEGWRGLNQFWFAIIGAGSNNGEHGGEHDGGTDPQDGEPLANNFVLNATYIGGGDSGGSQSDSAGFQLRDNWGGQYHNSVFTEFLGEAMDIENDGDPAGSDTPARLAAGEIVFDNNTWWNFSYDGSAYDNTVDGMVLDGADVDVSGFWTETELFEGEAFTNDIEDPMLISISRLPDGGLDPRPASGSPLLDSPTSTAMNPFFTFNTYRGAFSADQNWAKGWTLMDALGFFPAAGVIENPQSELINVSTRGFLNSGPGNEFNLGFQISGNVPTTVVISVKGEETLRPVFDAALGGDSSSISLAQDPNMTIRRTDVSPPIVVLEQDNWSELSADLLDLLSGTAFDPTTGDSALGANEALVPVTLEPGNYTVQVFGADENDSGVVLGEVTNVD